MEKKDARRIQESVLSKWERRTLGWLANRLPEWVTPDFMTGVGLAGAIIASVGYILSNWGKGFLWLSSFGFVINWFGDSLDGSLARHRKIERPKYGFYIDHNVDAITALVICLGAGLSPFVSFSVVMVLLVAYFMLSIITYINTYLNEIFRISYSGLGPTELRLMIIIINAFFFFMSPNHPDVVLLGIRMKFFDLFVLFVAMVMMILYFYSFIRGRKEYEKADPPRE